MPNKLSELTLSQLPGRIYWEERNRREMKALFLCTGNSARSQMAEGLLRMLGPADWQVYSAGTRPVGLNPQAVAVMAEWGLDISGQHSKGLAEAPAHPDVAITVCDNAARECPVFPGNVRRLHWSVDDPAASAGSPEQLRQAFRRARDELRGHILEFLRDVPQKKQAGRPGRE